MKIKLWNTTIKCVNKMINIKLDTKEEADLLKAILLFYRDKVICYGDAGKELLNQVVSLKDKVENQIK